MIIEKNEIRLITDTFANVGMFDEKDNANIFKAEVKRYISIIQKFISNNFNDLSDEAFYDIVKETYSVTLEEKDYLKILSSMYEKEYDRFVEIDTTMTFKDTATEGRGRDFSWWKQLYQVKYVIAVSSGCIIDCFHTFSKIEIEKLVKDKHIVIVNLNTEPLIDDVSFKKENFQKFPVVDLGIANFAGNIFGYIENNENFHFVISMLRRKFTKKRILKDMTEYFEELQCQINEIVSDSSGCYCYAETSRLCNEWFRESEEKKIFERLQTSLDILNNH